MASNLQKRLDKLEKGIQQLQKNKNPQIYLAEGESAPEGTDAIHIVMHWVEATHLEDDAQSVDSGVGTVGEGNNSRSNNLGSNSAPKKQPSTLPPSESAAAREERWRKHLQTIDKDRYQGEEPRDTRRKDWQQGIV